MKRGFIHMGALSMSLQQLDLMIMIAKKAEIPLHDICAMGKQHGQWYLKINNWGWVSTSELLAESLAKGAIH